MPYQSIGDFPVNFMMNQFNLSNWYDNDESDLNESIDLNLEEPVRVASPHRINLEEPVRVASPHRINLEEPGRVASPHRINLEEPGQGGQPT